MFPAMYWSEHFTRLANQYQVDRSSENLADHLDQDDQLHRFQHEFHKPTFQSLHTHGGKTFHDDALNNSEKCVIYFTGHSLGLQPKRMKQHLALGMKDWTRRNLLSKHVETLPPHLHNQSLGSRLGQLLLGAVPTDTVHLVNGLSENLTLAIAKFYRPTGSKRLILIEQNAFPSDYYCVYSQIAWHGLSPAECIVELKPGPSDWCLNLDQVVATIRQYGQQLALVLLPGTQYITGQLFDIETITQTVHKFAKCPIGWDLAHTIGTTSLLLHDWNVDFAVWCSYKYLNAGPGVSGGLFIHAVHNETLKPSPSSPDNSDLRPDGIESCQPCKLNHSSRGLSFGCSPTPLLLSTALQSSLEIFDECGGLEVIRAKSKQLTGYLQFLIEDSSLALPASCFTVISPSHPEARGPQLTLHVKYNLANYARELDRRGCICDTRGSKMMRIAPSPLYNTYHEVYTFVKIFHHLVFGELDS